MPPADIHLGRDASETTVKRAALAEYGIVYFATHGLVAGDIKGVGEPSLALSIPDQPSELDDGLLTASEVAQLKLNADWVVLSACNTIAGDKPGAEALSGLARSFFYAGARALLVSHWAVDSEAATRLDHFDLRAAQNRTENRPRRSAAPRDASLSQRHFVAAKRLSCDVGALRADRRRRGTDQMSHDAVATFASHHLERGAMVARSSQKFVMRLHRADMRQRLRGPGINQNPRDRLGNAGVHQY